MCKTGMKVPAWEGILRPRSRCMWKQSVPYEGLMADGYYLAELGSGHDMG